MKNRNKEIAEQSLEIIKTGVLQIGEKSVVVRNDIEQSISLTFTASPDNLAQLQLQRSMPTAIVATEITVVKQSTLEALFQEQTSGLKVAVLNFASAKKPGGGFIGGASSQEESLARSSSLSASLTKDFTMYQYNRARATFLYSDYMIYSPEVLFWMDDTGTVLETPVKADVITAPAPNKGAMLQHKRQHEIDAIESTFKTRIDKLLALAQSQQVECLILGAWGCGVFKNDPSDVARYFKEAIDSTYKHCFKKVVFAIYGGSRSSDCLNAFQLQFSE
jgi:uncharacterized protein (TIGR02452 family)